MLPLNIAGLIYPGLSKDLLLNRAYNLQAKIATLLGNGNDKSSKECYKKAICQLPNDVTTLSNYERSLVDFGRPRKNPRLYVKPYRRYEKIETNIEQINQGQLEFKVFM
ncbi:MAG: hypothetical protein BGO68_03775 [Candidatus Amoebophilus sp. 36-38]|nr:MAG: hypothetical protein BGO68_03775 [Candidatus Amoebophilus sp. 36-38]